MSVLRHPNIVMFLGACSQPPCMVTEYCARGSLLDILTRAREYPVRPYPAHAHGKSWPPDPSRDLSEPSCATIAVGILSQDLPCKDNMRCMQKP